MEKRLLPGELRQGLLCTVVWRERARKRVGLTNADTRLWSMESIFPPFCSTLASIRCSVTASACHNSSNTANKHAPSNCLLRRPQPSLVRVLDERPRSSGNQSCSSHHPRREGRGGGWRKNEGAEVWQTDAAILQTERGLGLRPQVRPLEMTAHVPRISSSQ